MKRRQQAKLPLLVAGLGGAALAGFGLSFGRDVYHRSKKNIGVIFLFACLSGLLLCAYFAGRGLTRGHDRGFWGRIFFTHLGNYLLIIVSLVAVETILFLVMMLFAGKMVEADLYYTLLPVLFYAAVVVIIATLAGMVAGLLQRKKRLRAFIVAKENALFMRQNNIEETGGVDITHIDGVGNALRLLEVTPSRLVFMVVGRRGKRAYINLDQDGRMLAYSCIL